MHALAAAASTSTYCKYRHSVVLGTGHCARTATARTATAISFGLDAAEDSLRAWLGQCDRLNIDPRDPRRKTPVGHLQLPKFVKFHLLDPGSDRDEILWQDPSTFTPRRGRNGYVDSWGIYPMNTQRLYTSDIPLPEIHFINALIDRKLAQLSQLDITDLSRRDFTLYLSLPFIDNPYDPRSDRYWRRIRLSAGLPLSVFADKIITPLWGWVRNLHAHAFHDYKDGALFGPKDTNAIDASVHLDKAGYAYIPEEGLASPPFLQKEGDVIGYQYDSGDNWWVDIKLEEIAPRDTSTGAVVVLDGAGGYPPDGESSGTFSWAIQLRKAAQSPAGKRNAVKVLFGATNYQDKNPPLDPLDYDFDAFDLGGMRKAIRDALDSKGSLHYASKKFVTPFAPMDEMNSDSSMLSRLGRTARNMKKGTAVSQTPVPGHGGMFLEEGVKLTRTDKPTNTACANCGTPHDLKACSRCGQRYYCGKASQRAHWKESHKMICGKSAQK
ncbi:hypothetical protein BD309DRAFT_869765 [Dichomitus squalens]|nr:hypothetical protein BD309DRAFT_869765 [Dichomitus squalens]